MIEGLVRIHGQRAAHHALGHRENALSSAANAQNLQGIGVAHVDSKNVQAEPLDLRHMLGAIPRKTSVIKELKLLRFFVAMRSDRLLGKGAGWFHRQKNAFHWRLHSASAMPHTTLSATMRHFWTRNLLLLGKRLSSQTNRKR